MTKVTRKGDREKVLVQCVWHSNMRHSFVLKTSLDQNLWIFCKNDKSLIM